MFGEVTRFVDHRPAKVSARHRREDCRPDRDIGQDTFPLEKQYEREEGADHHREPKIEV